MGSEVKRYIKLIKDEKKLQEIGSEIVRMSIKNAAEERMNLPIENPTIERSIERGQKVPAELMGQVDIINGVAASGWTKSWLDLGIWSRNTSTDEHNNMWSDKINKISNEIKFDREEIKVLKDLDINI